MVTRAVFTVGLKDLKALLALGTEDLWIVSSFKLSYIKLGSSTSSKLLV
jgi:hypothetical protein